MNTINTNTSILSILSIPSISKLKNIGVATCLLTVDFNAKVYRVCATHDLNVFSAIGNSMIPVQTQQDSICPKYANVSLGGNTRVFNMCASEMLTIQSVTGDTMANMNYKQLSSCAKVVNIVNGAGNTIFYVCATQAINVKFTGIATLYYKGPLNHTVISGLASVYLWI